VQPVECQPLLQAVWPIYCRQFQEAVRYCLILADVTLDRDGENVLHCNVLPERSRGRENFFDVLGDCGSVQ
jgi:hypothetical protein